LAYVIARREGAHSIICRRMAFYVADPQIAGDCHHAIICAHTIAVVQLGWPKPSH
jgi:hypothetical protein